MSNLIKYTLLVVLTGFLSGCCAILAAVSGCIGNVGLSIVGLTGCGFFLSLAVTFLFSVDDEVEERYK